MTIYQSPWRLSEVYLEISRTKQPGARFDNLHLAHPASPPTIRNKEKKKKKKRKERNLLEARVYIYQTYQERSYLLQSEVQLIISYLFI